MAASFLLHASVAAIIVAPLASACATSKDKAVNASSNGTVAAAPAAAVQDTSAMTIASVTAPVALSAGPVRVALRAAAGQSLAARLRALAPGHRLYLVAQDLRADEPPSDLFHLYLNVPAGESVQPTDRRHVGSINFYDANRPTGAGLRHSFDITDALRSTDAAQLDGDFTVTISPSTHNTSAVKAVIGRLAIIEQ